MGRWNENNEWRQLGRWLAVAAGVVYVGIAAGIMLMFSETFAQTLAREMNIKGDYGWLEWAFRIIVGIHIAAVVWICCKCIDYNEGEWPN